MRTHPCSENYLLRPLLSRFSSSLSSSSNPPITPCITSCSTDKANCSQERDSTTCQEGDLKLGFQDILSLIELYNQHNNKRKEVGSPKNNILKFFLYKKETGNCYSEHK